MMDVWDPGEEKTIFSQIKKLLSFRTGPLRSLPGQYYPGNLVFWIKDYFYSLCETYGGKISCWAWHKRWNKRDRKRYKHG